VRAYDTLDLEFDLIPFSTHSGRRDWRSHFITAVTDTHADWCVLGRVELYYDRGNHQEFTSLVRELARPGELIQNASYDFEFVQVEKPYESYTGANVKLRCLSFHFSLCRWSCSLL